MQERKTQISALLEALDKAGFTAEPDFDQGTIILKGFPEFKEKPVFQLTIVMDAPKAHDYDSLFDGCILESGRLAGGAAHGSRLYSRKAAVERAKQEKWVATWTLHDAGILPPKPRPTCERWQDVTLP